MDRHAEYLICQQRGHSPGEHSMFSPDGELVAICRHCGTGYWTETIVRETNVPVAAPALDETELRMEAYGTPGIGVALLHVPSGITEAADEEPTRLANTAIALEKLAQRVREWEPENKE